MTRYDFDFFVIGGGSGGVRAARIAAGHGAKTAIAEGKYWGGTCVNVGCVPKKLMSYAAHFSDDFEEARSFGWDVSIDGHSWTSLITAKNQEIKRLNGIYQTVLEKANVTILNDYASFIDQHRIQIGDQTLTAEKILIATGGKPNRPEHPGADLAITSNDFFYLPERPKNALIAGGGYIALEFASILNGLGTDVTLIYRGDRLLRSFDDDIRAHIGEELTKKGIKIIYNAPSITEITGKPENEKIVTLEDGTILKTDCVIYAFGRSPNTRELNLEKIGLETAENKSIIVNDDFQTNIPHIYAVGDVIDRVALTPVAINEGHALADNLFNSQNRKIDYRYIASAVFTNPPIATCGLTEDQARNDYSSLRIYTSQFRPMKYSFSQRDEKTFMKLIVDNNSDRIVGCHMIGPDTPEMMQAVSIAMNMNATKADFDRTIGIHPTSAEEFVTMRSLSRQIDPPSV